MRRSWRTSWAVTTVLVLLALSVGLGRYLLLSHGSAAQLNPSPTPSPTATLPPRPGGTYTEGTLSKPQTLNPFFATMQIERDIAAILFDPLVGLDASGQPIPSLATSWKLSDDGRTYTLTLRADVTWHDGTPFTASDVLYTIRLLQAPDFPGDPTLSHFWRSVVVSSSSPTEVRFTLPAPFSPFLNYLSIPILPAHRLAGVLPRDLPTDSFSTSPIGTGPYRLVQFDAERGTVTLARYDGYYGEKPYLDQVIIRAYPDVPALAQAFASGAIQGIGTPPIDLLLRPGALGSHARIYAPLVPGYTALFFNLRDQLFADVRVRQAIALAIDRQHLVQDALHQLAEPGSSPVPASLWAYAPQPATVNLDRARQLLNEAGWQDQNGVLQRNGTPFRFTLLVNSDDPQRLAAAQAVANALGQLHMQVTVQALSPAALEQTLLNRQFTAAIYGWYARQGDPDSFTLWSSSQVDSGANISGFRNQAVDTLLQQARTTAAEADRKALYAEFQRVFAEQVPAVILYYPRLPFVVSDTLGGVDATPLVSPSDRLREVIHWYLVAPK